MLLNKCAEDWLVLEHNNWPKFKAPHSKVNEKISGGRILVHEQSHRNVSKRYAPMEDNAEFGSFNVVSEYDPKED